MNESRPLSAEERAEFSAVFETLNCGNDNISRFVDSRLGKVYDVFLLNGDTVLKKCRRDKEQYDRYFANTDFAVPAIADGVLVEDALWCKMPFIGGNDARNCTPEQAAAVGRELARIQRHYLAPGGHTAASDHYWGRYTGRYAKKVISKFPEQEAVFKSVAQRFFEAPLSLIHDDLLPINVLLAENKPWFIDWDCAGIYPYFLDLARFAYIYDETGALFLSPASGEAFLAAYYEEMRKNPDFTVDRPQFNRDVAISAFCQYVMFLYYQEDAENDNTQDDTYFKRILAYLAQ